VSHEKPARQKGSREELPIRYTRRWMEPKKAPKWASGVWKQDTKAGSMYIMRLQRKWLKQWLGCPLLCGLLCGPQGGRQTLITTSEQQGRQRIDALKLTGEHLEFKLCCATWCTGMYSWMDGVGSRQIMPAVIKVNRPPEH